MTVFMTGRGAKCLVFMTFPCLLRNHSFAINACGAQESIETLNENASFDHFLDADFSPGRLNLS